MLDINADQDAHQPRKDVRRPLVGVDVRHARGCEVRLPASWQRA
jgi:nitrogen fixation protein